MVLVGGGGIIISALTVQFTIFTENEMKNTHVSDTDVSLNTHVSDTSKIQMFGIYQQWDNVLDLEEENK